jgi:tRNA1(Val) A37 N6-methylase TrmN6
MRAEDDAPQDVVSHDTFLSGRLHLAQFRKGHHRGGTDGVLAAMQVLALAPGRLVDLGAGTGLIGLAAAVLRPALTVTLVEREPELADLCRANVTANDCAARVVVFAADVLGAGTERRAAGLVAGMADCVVTNPPWFDPTQGRRPAGEGRSRAHAFDADDGSDPLTRWLRTAADVVAPGGHLVMIHRADALPELLAAIGRRFGGLRIRPVHARRNEAAIRVLITGRKGSRAAASILPPLVLHAEDGSFTSEAAALHEGRLPEGFG